MKSFLKTAIIFAFALIFSTIAQAQGGHSVTAELIDAKSSEPVSFATVSLTKKGETKVYKYALSAEDGKVKIDGVRNGNYILKAELMGYETFTKEITVTDNAALGKLKMGEDRQLLDAASVSAVGNPIIIKKDTIEYNANAFKTTENDVLEDLLKKLPGVEVSEDGSITVNGETIKKITIDGKTFFLDDPQLASKNLPAKIVNKVKVVEKKSEQAAFTGIDDGEEETVIDLNLKPGMMKGMFGNVMGGAGHDMPSQASSYDDWRYQGAAFVGKFTDKTQLSLVLNANNTNNRGFNDLSGSMMGNMRGGGGGMGRGQGGWGNQNGITTSYMGGLNGAWTLCDGNMDLGGNYLFNATEKAVKEKSSKRTFVGEDYDLLYNNEGYSNTNSYGHRFGVRLEHKFSENTSILFQPSVNFGTGNFNEFSDNNTYKDAGNVSSLLNDGFNLNTGSNKNWSTDGFFLLRQRLGIPGRTITAMGRYAFSNNDLNGFNQSLTTSYDTGAPVDSVMNQRYESNRRSSSVFGRVTYTEPLGNHFYVEANYEYRWSKSTSYKDTYDSGDNTGFSASNPLYRTMGEKFNPIYSNSINNEAVNQTIGANMLYQQDKFRFQVGFGARPTKTTNETYKNGALKTYESNVLNWAPQAMFNLDMSESSNFHIFYFGRSEQPSTAQLMPVPDNTNPLNISFGNPSLRPFFNHNIRGGLRYNNKQNFASVNGRFGGGFVSNPIVNAIWYGSNGTQYSMPYNGPTSANADCNFFVNAPIAKSDFTITNITRVNFSSSSSYVGKGNIQMNKYYKDGDMDYDLFLQDYPDLDNTPDFQKNTITNLGFMERLRVTYRTDALELRASGRTRYSHSWYTLENANPTSTWNNQVDFSVNWTWETAGLVFKSDFDYNWYRGYSTPQPDEYVLNAEIQKLLFKKKVTLAVKGYDILDQAKNLNVTDSANFHQETWNNTLGRYIMVSLTYRFGTFDKNKMRGGMMGGMGGHGGPMGGGRGPRG